MSEDQKIKPTLPRLGGQREVRGDDPVQVRPEMLRERVGARNNTESDTVAPEHRQAESPFVGRRAEFQVLQRRIENLVQGQGRFVSLTGEAGMGKSRLIAELRKHVCEADGSFPLQWLEGSARDPMKNAGPYLLFRQMLRHYAEIGGQEDESEARHRFESRLAPLFGDRSTDGLQHLATMMGLRASDVSVDRVKGLSNEAVSLEILRATEQLFENMAH
jgi:hypothetical protein